MTATQAWLAHDIYTGLGIFAAGLPVTITRAGDPVSVDMGVIAALIPRTWITQRRGIEIAQARGGGSVYWRHRATEDAFLCAVLAGADEPSDLLDLLAVSA